MAGAIETSGAVFGDRDRPALVDAGLVVLVAVVFGKAIGFPFVDWDDRAYLVDNPLVRAPLAHGWRTFLSAPGMGYPQPLVLLTQRLDLAVGAGAAWAFHLDNLLLAVAAAVLAHRLLRQVGLGTAAAGLGAAIWACHPVVAEPICWATGRKDLLATVAILGGVLVFVRAGPTGGARAAAAFIACGAAALCSKPTGAVLPPLALLAAWTTRRPPAAALRGAIAIAALLAIVVVAVAWVGQHHHGVMAEAEASRAGARRLSFVSQHLALQLRNWLWPARLSAKYLEDLPRPALSAWGVAGIGVTLALGAAFVLAARRRARLPLAGLGWLAITFAPSSGLAPLNRGPADTYFYLPSLALAAGLGAALAALKQRQRAGRLLAGVVPATLALAAFVQADTWRSSSAIWRNVRDRYPDHRGSWWAYADALAHEGAPRSALAVYEEGLRRFPYPPSEPAPLLSLARGYATLGDRTAAARWVGETLRHFPDARPRVAADPALGPLLPPASK